MYLPDCPKLLVVVVAVIVEVADGLVAGPAETSPEYLEPLYHQDEDPDLSTQKH